MKILLLSLVALISFAGYGQEFKNVGAAEFKTLIEKHDGVIIDVRTPQEYDRGHIAEAELYSLQDPQVAQKLSQLPKDKPVYLYCYSGARSRSAATFLSQNGYANVYNLQRGTIDWTGSGFPLEKKGTVASSPQENDLSVAQYQKIISESPVVFVDFYAPWCAPCKRMMPSVDALAKEYDGKVTVLKVNSDASGDLVKHLGIKGVPYLYLYKAGKPVFTYDGALEKADIQAVFDKHL